jgi:nicotinate-nucleotide adenylyltransferase
MRVALFGGSFNPPHVGHQLAALYVLETEDVDELWFVPCYLHPFDKSLADFDDRMAMCERVAAALGLRARVSDCERQLGGESVTLRTVKALQAQHPTTEFQLVVGADLQSEIASWYGAVELQQLVRFIVVGRAGFRQDEGAVPMPPVSSSEVRQRLGARQPVGKLVPRSVLDYIHERKLYGLPENR